MIENLTGKSAVITGGASGIGFGTATALAASGMNVLLADIEPNALDQAAQTLAPSPGRIVSAVVDVSDPAAVEDLADQAFSEFGEVHVVFNNAGVIENNLATWEYSLEDWNWVFGINVMGVVHGVRSFVPKMLAQDAAGHVVNTASFGGLISGTANPIYITSKHAVVALTENLYNDFKLRETNMSASVLCPGWVRTSIAESDRNREDAPALNDETARIRKRFRQGLDSGLEPVEVGQMVADAIVNDRFYIHTHPDWLGVVQQRFDCIFDGKAPSRSRIPNPRR